MSGNDEAGATNARFIPTVSGVDGIAQDQATPTPNADELDRLYDDDGELPPVPDVERVDDDEWPDPLRMQQCLIDLIHGSGISRAVFEARGYDQIAHKADAVRDLGYSRQQQTGLRFDGEDPGVVIPMYGAVSGTRDGVTIRMSRKGVLPKDKYKKPTGQANVLDVSPLGFTAVHDASVPLDIVEGVKKADSLYSHGALAVIALDGVDGWQGGNALADDDGGYSGEKAPTAGKNKGPHLDWAKLPLEGRLVRVMYDSDVATNSNIKRSRNRLTEYLRSLGARVVWVTPPADGDDKVGADDYLVAGNSLESLYALAVDPLVAHEKPEKVSRAVKMENAAPYERQKRRGYLGEIIMGPVTFGGDGNAADMYDLTRSWLGRPQLPGFYMRRGQMVRCPRIDEKGYVAPDPKLGKDGPAQVRPVKAETLMAYIQSNYWVGELHYNEQTDTWKPSHTYFPGVACHLALADAPENDGIPRLDGVTHTPMMRDNGSVIDEPGYDEYSRHLFLPPTGVRFPKMPAVTEDSVHWAVQLLDYLLIDMPFVSPTDKANYLALLLTPVMRQVLPPPYPWFPINAHQPGSGKSLLANVAGALHGIVHRPDLPPDDEEIRKQISSALLTTTAPLIVWDNLTGVVRSGQLANLWTTDVWEDRKLGSNDATSGIEVANDRIWLGTGNNIRIGGDLPRRTYQVNIDPGVPRPELRTEFREKDLVGFAQGRQGDLVNALLIIAGAWVQRGMPETHHRSDYTKWSGAVSELLMPFGLRESFIEQTTVKVRVGEDDAELGDLLEALWDVFGTKTFRAKDVEKALSPLVAGASVGDAFRATENPLVDALPARQADMHAKGRSVAKSLGRYFADNEGRYVNDLAVKVFDKDARGGALWQVSRHG